MKRSGWREALIAYAPLVLWIGVIFFLSSEQGSMGHTSRFIRPLLMFLFPATPEETLQIYHGYIRKAAHFSEYAVLAFFAMRAFSSALQIGGSLRYLLAFLLVAAIAAVDEFHQGFEATRTSSVYDVLLDVFGGAAALVFMAIIKRPRPASLREMPEPPST